MKEVVHNEQRNTLSKLFRNYLTATRYHLHSAWMFFVGRIVLNELWYSMHPTKLSDTVFSRTVRSGRLIFSLWRVVGWLLVCGQLFQLFTPGGSPGSNFKY